MQLVVDANVVMSALARDSTVRTALRITPDEVATPWYIAVEIDKHRGEIRTKSGLSSDAFDDLLDTLWVYIEVVPQDEMRPHLQEAARAMHAYDPDDTLYAAAALAVDGAVVSNDKAFEKQQVVPHLWTSEFVNRALGEDADEDDQ